MAEAVAFSLASKLLSAIANPAFTAAYNEGLSIWEAKDELSKLQVTIQTIRGVLLDAEKRQQDSDAIKDWIKRLKGVLYEADDLFDEVVTRDLLKKKIQKGSHNHISKKVLVSFSMLNPVISRYSIAKEVRAIRKSLVEISTDMAPFEFLISQNDVPTHGIRMVQDPGSYVDADLVIGREDDKKVVLEMLFSESNSAAPTPPVIAIVGAIGGLGKTTLAQLIYNDDEVKKKFDNRWFACISDISDEREVLEKIFQSIKEGNHSSLSAGQLQTKIMDSVKGKRFLLILDDVWEDNRGKWQHRMSLFRCCAKGSKIIVTTRLSSVAQAMDASGAHNLEGLSEEDALCLFKRLAFAPGYENDPGRISSGKEILKICRGVPLAIQSVGSLLFGRNTTFEWKEIERQGLLVNIGNNETMSVIKLSYDHLSSNLKHCFAYCSLFPKDYRFMKHELIHLWIAQGYIEPNNAEEAFMYLLRRGFFQETEKDVFGEVISCKMHDIMHDLALYVAGEESIVMRGTTSWNQSSFALHVSVDDIEWDVEQLKVKRLHSFIVMSNHPICNLRTLDKLCKKFKVLRTLVLRGLGFKQMLPNSIGELTLMRYLDLSFNAFEELPDSMTNLVNLLALNLIYCKKLKALPKKCQNLINLKYLNTTGCRMLEMPIGIGQLTHLEYLSEVTVWKRSGMDALAVLHQQLRGKLLIDFQNYIMDEGEFCNWKLPCAQRLVIKLYKGVRIPNWGIINEIERAINHLTHLKLKSCSKVKCLPPLRCLPNLRCLMLVYLRELEFVEPVEDSSTSSSSPYLPRLEKLKLKALSRLKRWRETTPTTPLAFPLLSHLEIEYCGWLELASFPECPRLQQINFRTVDDKGGNMQGRPPLLSTLFCPSVSPPPLEDVTIFSCEWLWSLQVEATASLRRLDIGCCLSLKSLHLASPHLQKLRIRACFKLVTLELATPSLTEFTILDCWEFRNLIIGAPLNALQEWAIAACREFDLLGLELDWDSLVNLRELTLLPMPPTEEIPLSLRNRQARGALQITHITNRRQPFVSLSLSSMEEEEEEEEKDASIFILQLKARYKN